MKLHAVGTGSVHTLGYTVYHVIRLFVRHSFTRIGTQPKVLVQANDSSQNLSLDKNFRIASQQILPPTFTQWPSLFDSLRLLHQATHIPV